MARLRVKPLTKKERRERKARRAAAQESPRLAVIDAGSIDAAGSPGASITEPACAAPGLDTSPPEPAAEPKHWSWYAKRAKHGPTIPTRFTPRFWTDADQRSGDVKRVAALVRELVEQSGSTSKARELICQRAAFLAILLETREVEAVAGGAFDAGAYVQATNGLLGLLRAIGLDRKAKRAGLSDFIAKAATA